MVEVDAPGGDRPLRGLSSAEIADIALEVPLTGGTLEVLRHYLPRVLEIAASEGFEDDWPDIQVVLNRLSDQPDVGGEPWWNWPTQERSAVQRFLDALWGTSRRSTSETTDQVLCAISLAVPDLQPYLDEWASDQDPAAIANLRSFVSDNRDVVAGGSFDGVWWDWEYEPAPSNRARLIAWLGERAGPSRSRNSP